MLDLTIGIIGRISAGKSTVSKKLSEKVNIPSTSFGGYLVRYCKSKNLAADRTSLQDLGEKFINENPREFLYNVINDLEDFKGKIILEGIRHAVIVNEIRNASKNVLIVFIDTSLEVRYQRYLGRQKEVDTKLSFDEFITKDNHLVESEIESLKSSSD